MKSLGSGPMGDGYTACFQVEEGNDQKILNMNVYSVYGKAKDPAGKTLPTYNRVSLSEVEKLMQKFRTQEAKIEPYKVARKPEYLLQWGEKYIYVDNLEGSHYNFNVYIGSKGTFEKIPVYEVERERGSTYISLDGDREIGVPWSRSKQPKFTDSDKKEYTLQKLDAKDFDYGKIGIQLEPMNPRRTPLDLYK